MRNKPTRVRECVPTQAELDKLNSLNQSNCHLAREIGLPYFTLWNVRSGRTGCSKAVYEKIVAYLENIK